MKATYSLNALFNEGMDHACMLLDPMMFKVAENVLGV